MTQFKLKHSCDYICTTWAKKLSHYKIIKNYIALKSANEIRITVKLKYQSSTIILSVGIKSNILRVTYFVTSMTMPDSRSSDHIR